MANSDTEWTDAIFYCTFMAAKQSFGMPAMKAPNTNSLQRNKELITGYCTNILLNDKDEIEDSVRKFATDGADIRAALGVCANWKSVLLSKLSTATLLEARSMQAIGREKLEQVLPLWREKATGLQLTVLPNFTDNTSAGGVEMWISYKDIQNGAIATMFALGHEFGHQTDFALRDTHPEVLKALFKDWSKNDHASWEFYADTFSITYLTLISGDRAKLMDRIETFMENEADDGVHPEGRQRVNAMRAAQNRV